jgi:hypothetical protein
MFALFDLVAEDYWAVAVSGLGKELYKAYHSHIERSSN